MPAPDSPHPRPQVRRSFFSCLVLVTALGALDQTIVATALPTITRELGTPSRAPWIVTAYALALTAAMPVVGALGDRFGRRRMLGLSIALFILASAACGLAGRVELLAAARLMQGIGGAGLLVLPQAVVADVVAARDRAAYLGPLGAVFAIATAVSPLLGGWLTDTASWRWIFWLNLPLGAAAVALVITTVPATPRTSPGPRARFDSTGAALIVTSTSGLVLVSAVVAEQGWTTGTIGGTIATALVALTALWWERRATSPVLPIAVPRFRMIGTCYLLALLAGLGLFGVLAYVPTWVQSTYRTSASTAGLMLLPATAGIVIGMNISGHAVRRWGRWRPFPVAGCAVSAAAATTLAAASDNSISLPASTALLALLGLGTGLFMQVIVVVAQDSATAQAVGAITSSTAFVREIGVTVGAAVLGALIVHEPPGSIAPGSAFTPVFLATAACFAIGLVLALTLPHHTLSSKPQEKLEQEH